MDKASDTGASTRSPRRDKNKDNPNEPPVIGNYKIDRTLGQGTYGKVKLGIQQQTGDKVAIKIIEKANIQSQRQVARIQREIRFLKLLHHPHIVKVYEVHETADQIFIIMENVQGGELFDYIVSHKRVKEKEARVFYRMMLSALHYCHANAVIHRDLKPENLLLDNDKTIKIIDFGFGNTFKPQGLLETFCGSPFYAAPEMILGKKYEGPEVDLWSIGVILFALLCGHLPFDDENIKELYKKIAAGSFTCPSYLSSSAKHLIQRLITVDPRKRATLDEVLNHSWVNEGFSKSPHSFLPERPIIRDPALLSPDIVNRLNAFNYSKDEIDKAFLDEDQSKPNPVRSTYFLLQEMLAREEKKLRDQKKAGIMAASPNKSCIGLSASQTTLVTPPSTMANATSSLQPISDGAIHPPPAPVIIVPATTSAAVTSTGNSNSSSPSNSCVYIAGLTPNTGATAVPEVTCSLYSISEDGGACARPEPNVVSGPPVAGRASNNNTLGITAANKGAFTSMPQVVVTGGDGSKSRRSSSPHANPDPLQGEQQPTNQLLPIRIPERPRHSTTSLNVESQSAPPVIMSSTNNLAPPHPTGGNGGSPSSTVQGSSRRFSLANITAGNKRRSSTTPATNPMITAAAANTAANANSVNEEDQEMDRINNHSQASSTAENNARTMNSWFLNVNTTSAKPVAEIMQEVKRVLREAHVEYSHDGTYMIVCKMADLVFEIEICKVPRLSLFGLHFKRISGGIWTYKKLCNKLLSQMNL